MKIKFLFLIIIFIPMEIFSQSKEIEAKAVFMEASKAYENGNYAICLIHLDKTEKLLGQTQPVILHLQAKSYFNLKYYRKSQSAIENYFKLNPPENSHHYKDMISLMGDLSPILETQNKLFKQIKTKEWTDDINKFIADYPNFYENYEEIYLIAVKNFYIGHKNIDRIKKALEFADEYAQLNKEKKVKGSYIAETKAFVEKIQSYMLKGAYQELKDEDYKETHLLYRNYKELFPNGRFSFEFEGLKNKLDLVYLYDERDGQGYTIKLYGDNLWMTENLNYKTTDGSWTYDNNSEGYGRYYTWEMANKACPSGWHLPSEEEWKDLFKFVLDSNDEYFDKLYSLDTRKKLTNYMTVIGNNKSEFNLDFSHSYNFNKNEFFYDGGYWWTSNPINEKEKFATSFFMIDVFGSNIHRTNSNTEKEAISVRCVMNRN